MSKILIHKANTKDYKRYIIPRFENNYSESTVIELDLNQNLFIIERKNITMDELNHEEWFEGEDGSSLSMLWYFFISDEMRKVYLEHISR